MVVPNGKSPLAVHVSDAVFSLFLVKVKNDLSVREGGKAMSLIDQLLLEFEVVEDFAVERDPQRTVLVAHRLLAAREIDDAKPGMRETHAILGVKSSIVRPAMSQHPDHPAQGFRGDGRSIKIEYACNATHKGSILGAATSTNLCLC